MTGWSRVGSRYHTRFVAAIAAAFFFPAITSAKVWRVTPIEDLQSIVDRSSPHDTLLLSSGTWQARPQTYHDPFCGNCLDSSDGASATTGFVIRKSLTIIGSSSDSTILVTNAGYGILIDCSNDQSSSEPRGKVVLSQVKITGGKRDIDGNATDAGVVVRGCDVVLSSCSIIGNTHRIDSVVVGIAGIVGRVHSSLHIENTMIVDNGWDGIALYRGASAMIQDVIIRTGRGAGIGITWNSHATIIRAEVTGYWKGIGTFGDSYAEVYNSSIHDNLGWGLIATGQSQLLAKNNAVLRNGNCGVAMWSDDATGVFTNNLIVGNGWRKEWVCPCVGFWQGGTGKTTLFNNLFWQNVAGETKNVALNLFSFEENTPTTDTTGKFISHRNRIDDPGSIDSLGFPLQPKAWEFRNAGFDSLSTSRNATIGIGPAYGKYAKPRKSE